MGKEESLEKLDAISRTRPLTDSEVRKLERAIRRAAQPNERWHWTRAEDYRLIRHLLRGRKPKQIAILMKRSEDSIWRRMGRLGFSVTRVEKVLLIASSPGSGKRKNCPIAPDNTKCEE